MKIIFKVKSVYNFIYIFILHNLAYATILLQILLTLSLNGYLWYQSLGTSLISTVEPINDIMTVRLFDKIYIKGYGVWAVDPSDITQMYTSFLYDYKISLLRWGFYDDFLGWLDIDHAHVSNYDTSFLDSKRLSCKELAIFNIEVLDPSPPSYLFRTFYLMGLDIITGSPIRLAIHDGQIIGLSSLNDGLWSVCSGQDPFADGLGFKSVKIDGGYRMVDVLYYTDKTLLAYRGFGVPLDHTRVYILRGGDLDFTPKNPLVSYAPLNTLEEDIIARSRGVI